MMEYYMAQAEQTMASDGLGWTAEDEAMEDEFTFNSQNHTKAEHALQRQEHLMETERLAGAEEDTTSPAEEPFLQPGAEQVPSHEEETVVAHLPVALEKGESAWIGLCAPRRHRVTMGAGSLLSRPIAALRDDIDRQRAVDAVDASEAESADLAPDVTCVATSSSTDLWVDKYSPHAFMDLLSDERVNRQVLRWVKQWDPLVFGGRMGRPTASATPPQMRPERPLMLISGPPGLGKTTLAHIVARHAGYRPVEINASDERSAKILKQRVAEATEVRSRIGRPRHGIGRPAPALPTCSMFALPFCSLWAAGASCVWRQATGPHDPR